MIKKLSVLLFIPIFIFNLFVPVSASSYDPVYSFNIPRTYDSSSWDDTGISLTNLNPDRSFTFCIRFCPFTISGSVLSFSTISITNRANYFQVVNLNTDLVELGYDENVTYPVCVSYSGSDIFVYYISPGSDVVSSYSRSFSFTSASLDRTCQLGLFSGVIYDFAIYDIVFDADMAESYLTGDVVSPPAFSNEFSFLFVLLSVLILLFAIFVFVRK